MQHGHADRRMQQPIRPFGWLSDLYKRWTTRFERDEDKAYRTQTVAVRHALSITVEWRYTIAGRKPNVC